VKILIALSRGRTNILFLVILSGLAAFVAFKTSSPFRTVRGEKFLQDVKPLFSALRQRAASVRPGGVSCASSNKGFVSLVAISNAKSPSHLNNS